MLTCRDCKRNYYHKTDIHCYYCNDFINVCYHCWVKLQLELNVCWNETKLSCTNCERDMKIDKILNGEV